MPKNWLGLASDATFLSASAPKGLQFFKKRFFFIGNKWSDAGTFEKTLCMRRRAFIERSQSSHFEVAQKNVREFLRYLCSLAHNFNNSKVNHLNLASRPSLGDVRFHLPPRSHLARHLARQWFGRLW